MNFISDQKLINTKYGTKVDLIAFTMKHYWPCIDLIKHIRLHKMSALHGWSAITFLIPVNLQMISLSLKNTKLLLFTDLSGTVQQYTILLFFGSLTV